MINSLTIVVRQENITVTKPTDLLPDSNISIALVLNILHE